MADAAEEDAGAGREQEEARLDAYVLAHDRRGEAGIAAAVALVAAGILLLHVVSAWRNALVQVDPWVAGTLGALLAASLLRYRLSGRERLPEAALCALTVVETGLFVFLIWTYQYAHDHPAADVLKSPSIGFLFVAIGLRALRFHPAPTLCAGLAAVVGWIAMIGAVRAGGAGMTASYRDYLSGAHVLAGAEVEKLVALVLLTAVTAVAVWRARTLVGKAARIRALIEARRRAERLRRVAEAADRAKSDFIANMSHELRTPLNAINGFSDLMIAEVRGPISPVEYAGYLLDIRRSGEHLLGIIDDILDVSALGGGSYALSEERFAVHDLARRCVEAAEGEGPVPAIDPDSPEGTLHADRARIGQALLNVLGNARKFTPEGGRIVLWWRADPDALRIGCTDTGAGIAPEDVETILQPFGQTQSVMARTHGGLGLGLAIASQIASLHGGELGIESDGRTGTTVSIDLPPERWMPAGAPALSA